MNWANPLGRKDLSSIPVSPRGPRQLDPTLATIIDRLQFPILDFQCPISSNRLFQARSRHSPSAFLRSRQYKPAKPCSPHSPITCLTTGRVGPLLLQHQPSRMLKLWTDCIRFQEILLDQKLLFVAGVEVAKSKGRGEECISQNLRILRAKNGRRTIVLFANSQRKEKKGYISIPCEFSHTYGQIVSTH